MKKVVNGSKITFYDDNNHKIMYIDYATDECIWFFESNSSITVTEEMELYKPISFIMKQNYTFNSNDILKSYKNENKLVWYSDSYYDSKNEWSRKYVSFLTIEYNNGVFTLTPKKGLNDGDFFHCICFSPLGNGKYARNNELGTTLQDDFVLHVYRELLENNKVKKIGSNNK